MTTKITGPLAHARSHLMRAKTDAIMVGIDTVLIDDPQLTCRLEGLEDRSPVRIVVDTHARLPRESSLVKTAQNTPVWLLVGEGLAAQQVAGIEQAGVTIIKCPVRDSRINLRAAFKQLGALGLTSVLVEGGAKLAGALIMQGLADDVILIKAPKTLGPDGLSALGDMPLETVTNSEKYQLTEQMMLAEDQLTRYIRDNSDSHIEHI